MTTLWRGRGLLLTGGWVVTKWAKSQGLRWTHGARVERRKAAASESGPRGGLLSGWSDTKCRNRWPAASTPAPCRPLGFFSAHGLLSCGVGRQRGISNALYPSCAPIKGNAVGRPFVIRQSGKCEKISAGDTGWPAAFDIRAANVRRRDGVGEIFQVYLRNLREMREGIWAAIRNLSDVFVSL